MIVSAIMGQEIQLSIQQHGRKIATGISGNWLCDRQAKFSEVCVSSIQQHSLLFIQIKNVFVARPIPQNITTTVQQSTRALTIYGVTICRSTDFVRKTLMAIHDTSIFPLLAPHPPPPPPPLLLRISLCRCFSLLR